MSAFEDLYGPEERLRFEAFQAFLAGDDERKQAVCRLLLIGCVIDFICQDCTRRVTWSAAYEAPPVCCGWEMVPLHGTVREDLGEADEPPLLD